MVLLERVAIEQRLEVESGIAEDWTDMYMYVRIVLGEVKILREVGGEGGGKLGE